MKCQAGKVEMLDRLYRELKEQEEFIASNPVKKKGEHRIARAVQSVVRKRKGIGDLLHDVFEEDFGAKRTCQDCRAAIVALNRMQPLDVLWRLREIVQDIASRTAKQAPYLWQRIAVRIDQTLHLGQTEVRIEDSIRKALLLYLSQEG